MKEYLHVMLRREHVEGKLDDLVRLWRRRGVKMSRSAVMLWAVEQAWVREWGTGPNDRANETKDNSNQAKLQVISPILPKTKVSHAEKLLEELLASV